MKAKRWYALAACKKNVGMHFHQEAASCHLFAKNIGTRKVRYHLRLERGQPATACTPSSGSDRGPWADTLTDTPGPSPDPAPDLPSGSACRSSSGTSSCLSSLLSLSRQSSFFSSRSSWRGRRYALRPGVLAPLPWLSHVGTLSQLRFAFYRKLPPYCSRTA